MATDRQKKGEELKLDFYDENFNHLPIKQSHENANTAPKKPLHFEEMKVLAERLSNGIPHVRVDFYELETGILFGEMTFFSFSGMLPYQPEEWDKIFGNMLTLPGERGGGYLIDLQGGLYDYKFFCFNGEVKCFKIDFARFSNHRANYYTPQGEFLSFGEKSYPYDERAELFMPANLSKMEVLAAKLSEGFPFVRFYFYNCYGRILFGELTFYPASGFGEFTSEEWDEKLGDMLAIKNNKYL